MRIEYRIGLILAVCFVISLGIAGYISYTLQFRGARDEVNEKSRVLLETGLAVREYTSDQIAPLVRALGFEKDFHPEMVPSYGAQKTLSMLNKRFPDYVYRESSLNPTSVADRATDWEVGLIRGFKSDPNLKETYGITGEGEGLRYFLSRPLRMTTSDCLECHSTPDVAPKPMLAQYGSSNGFGWKMGDVIGIQIVEVPVLATRLKALHGVLVTVGLLACVMVLTLAIGLLLLRRYVIDPLESITLATDNHSLGARAPSGAGARTSGQLYELERAILRLKRSLDEAMRMLGGRAGRDRNN